MLCIMFSVTQMILNNDISSAFNYLQFFVPVFILRRRICFTTPLSLSIKLISCLNILYCIECSLLLFFSYDVVKNKSRMFWFGALMSLVHLCLTQRSWNIFFLHSFR